MDQRPRQFEQRWVFYFFINIKGEKRSIFNGIPAQKGQKVYKALNHFEAGSDTEIAGNVQATTCLVLPEGNHMDPLSAPASLVLFNARAIIPLLQTLCSQYHVIL